MARTANPKQSVKKDTGLIPVLPIRDLVCFPLQTTVLHVAREASVKAVREAQSMESTVIALSQRDMAVIDPGVRDMHYVGTLSDVVQASTMPDASLRVGLRGLRRVRLGKLVMRGGLFWGAIEELHEEEGSGVETEALSRVCVETFGRLVEQSKEIPPEALGHVVHLESPALVADAIAHHLITKPAEKQAVLECLNVDRRLELVLDLLKRELHLLDLRGRIHAEVDSRIEASHHEFFLREQLRIIQQQLRQSTHRLTEVEQMEAKINESALSDAALRRAREECDRLQAAGDSTQEAALSRAYLDILLDLPWSRETADRLDLREAKTILDADHDGLIKVKERILEHLAVRRLNGTGKGAVICFVGPPGVGKTSFARSIAQSMGRRFARIALGGIRDEAEVRGHRRAYVGAMPGRLIQAIRHAGSRNPVILLDEIDKISLDARSDPSAALLEALDPEQNHAFVDHFLEVPFDLSSVIFLATANSIDNLHPALRDRLDVVEFSAYTDIERAKIAMRRLFPRQCEAVGISVNDLAISQDVVQALVLDYTREAGVRDLHRQIGALTRKVGRAIAEGAPKPYKLDMEALHQFLGPAPMKRAALNHRDRNGVVTGLVVGPHGGETIEVEVALLPAGPMGPQIQLTGLLGPSMKESAQAAWTWVRGWLHRRDWSEDVHIHLPEGGIPKDGPSAGLALAIALASAATNRPVRGDTAVTGEVTLRGRVLAVGGLREKILAAHRMGIRRVIVPQGNQVDLLSIPDSVAGEVEVILVEDALGALTAALV
jgi:ATP-dependent Lon protease